MISVRGSFPVDLRGYRRVASGILLLNASGATAIPAGTTATIATPGIQFGAAGVTAVAGFRTWLQWKPKQALHIRRYVAGVAAAAAPNQLAPFAASMEIQSPAGPIGNGLVSNDSEMLSGDPNPSVANAQTLSDVSYTCMLRDDWFEFEDYQAGGNQLGLQGLAIRTFWRIRNQGAGANNAEFSESVLFDVYQKEILG